MREIKYKVGDKVRIKSLDWYNENKNSVDNCDVVFADGWLFSKHMSNFCGKELIIEKISHATNPPHYIMKDTMFAWTDEMIECKVEEEIKPKFKVGDILFYRGETSGYLKVEEIRVENGEIRYYETSRNVYLLENDPDVFADKVCSVETEETGSENKLLDDFQDDNEIGDVIDEYVYRLKDNECQINLPKGYIFKDENGNEILTNKITLEKKKKEVTYPKTYEECCTVLRFHYDHYLTYDDENDINPIKEEEEFIDLMDAFSRLIVCRNAYWKLADKEMGLGKPWEPDWKNDEQFKYVIICRRNCVIKDTFTAKDVILAFPTAEMRDDFYENFSKEIESCKELL
jgi:ASC-1-like (ASCH) protein